MEHDPSFNMDGIGEDLFFLSNGHISPVWYSVLARSGYFDIKEMSTFRKLNSRLQGHPATAEHLPGIRVASGSLGQGMSVAIGAALAKRFNGDKHMVYSLHGDGELDEGQNWEAIMSAAHLKVDNLISTVDWNGQQIDGPTVKVMNLGDLHAKFQSFGWETLDLNGNMMEEVVATLKHAKTLTGKGKPIAILMKTQMGYSIDFMAGNYEWHGVAPNDEQLVIALQQLPVTLGDY
jgi:transketolase